MVDLTVRAPSGATLGVTATFRVGQPIVEPQNERFGTRTQILVTIEPCDQIVAHPEFFADLRTQLTAQAFAFVQPIYRAATPDEAAADEFARAQSQTAFDAAIAGCHVAQNLGGTSVAVLLNGLGKNSARVCAEPSAWFRSARP